jgi:hypothetical protein
MLKEKPFLVFREEGDSNIFYKKAYFIRQRK